MEFRIPGFCEALLVKCCFRVKTWIPKRVCVITEKLPGKRNT